MKTKMSREEAIAYLTPQGWREYGPGHSTASAQVPDREKTSEALGVLGVKDFGVMGLESPTITYLNNDTIILHGRPNIDLVKEAGVPMPPTTTVEKPVAVTGGRSIAGSEDLSRNC